MKPKDEFWWAYVDSEMTPAEAAQYDRMLGPADHERMAGEMELERRLTDVLAQPAPEARDAWKHALAQVKTRRREQRFPRHWRRVLPWLAAPMAAMAIFAVCFQYGYGGGGGQEPWFLTMNTHDPSTLNPETAVPDVTLSVRNLLRDRAMNVAFDPMNSLASGEVPYQLLAAHGDEYAGEQVVELMFSCGSQPAKVVIANAGGNAAREIDRAVAKGRVRAARPVGSWIIALVGAEAPDALLSLIGEPDIVTQEAPVSADNLPATEAAPPQAEEPVAPPDTTTAPETPDPPTPSHGYPGPIKVAA